MHAFDQVIFFTPSTKSAFGSNCATPANPQTTAFPSDLNPQSIVDLISRGVNILVALSPSQTPLHSLAAEFGLILPPPQTSLVDHFNAFEKDPSKLILPIPKENTFFPDSRGGKIIYKGISMAYTPNPALFPILNAPAESYATDNDGSTDKGADAIAASAEKGGEGLWAGSSMGVVSGFVATTHRGAERATDR